METAQQKKQSALRFAGLGMQWLVLLGLAVWGGIRLDKWMGFRALAVVVLPLLALVISLYQLIKTLQKKS